VQVLEEAHLAEQRVAHVVVQVVVLIKMRVQGSWMHQIL